MVSKLSLGSLAVIWLEWAGVVDAEYAKAAICLADHLDTSALDGTSDSDEVAQVEFACALSKRNRMRSALSAMALRDVDASVTGTESYEQYRDGLITSVECCNALTLEACRKAA